MSFILGEGTLTWSIPTWAVRCGRDVTAKGPGRPLLRSCSLVQRTRVTRYLPCTGNAKGSMLAGSFPGYQHLRVHVDREVKGRRCTSKATAKHPRGTPSVTARISFGVELPSGHHSALLVQPSEPSEEASSPLLFCHFDHFPPAVLETEQRGHSCALRGPFSSGGRSRR